MFYFEISRKIHNFCSLYLFSVSNTIVVAIVIVVSVVTLLMTILFGICCRKKKSHLYDKVRDSDSEEDLPMLKDEQLENENGML